MRPGSRLGDDRGRERRRADQRRRAAQARVLAERDGADLRLPRLRLAVPLDRVRFRYDMFVYGVLELPVAW